MLFLVVDEPIQLIYTNIDITIDFSLLFKPFLWGLL